MKKLIALFMLILPFVMVAEEEGFQVKDKRVYWGFTLGADINFTQGGINHYLPQPGWGGSVGALSRIMITKKFFVEPGAKICYDYTWIRAADISDPRIQLNRWSVGVPLIFGYKCASDDNPNTSCFVPQIGVQYNHYFSTTTSGQVPEQRMSSSQLWYPNSLAACVGLGFYTDGGQFDIMFNIDLTRANKPENVAIYKKHYNPASLLLAFKFFF